MQHARRLWMAGSTRVSEGGRGREGEGEGRRGTGRENAGREVGVEGGREGGREGERGGCLHVGCGDYLTAILLQCNVQRPLCGVSAGEAACWQRAVSHSHVHVCDALRSVCVAVCVCCTCR